MRKMTTLETYKVYLLKEGDVGEKDWEKWMRAIFHFLSEVDVRNVHSLTLRGDSRFIRMH